MRPQADSGAEVELEIEKLVYGGDGLARRDGVIYFLPFVLPGEAVRARAVETRRNFVRARLEEVVRPAAARRPAPCPHFTVCGGCQYQHIAYEFQLETKREILRETLARLGRLAWDGPIALHPSPPFGYRNRAQWKVRPMGGAPNLRTQPLVASPAPPGALALGYFQAGSNRLCAVEECAVLAPPLAAALAALRTELAAGHAPASPHSAARRLGAAAALPAIREIEAFAAPDGALLLNVSLAELPPSPERLARWFRAAVPGARSVLLQDAAGRRMELDGPGSLLYEVGGNAYRVGHMSFFQINRFLMDAMIEQVAAGPPGALALDLHAGVGLFSVPLGRRFTRVVAVEANPAAARDLEANLKSARAAAPASAAPEAGAQAVNAEAEKFLADWRERPDLVVLDPPRSGLSADALAALARLRPGRIHYLSCEPPTLARDLRELEKSGYRIAALSLFDVFPQTSHIETLAVLAEAT